jgi:hypothetical protein
MTAMKVADCHGYFILGADLGGGVVVDEGWLWWKQTHERTKQIL